MEKMREVGVTCYPYAVQYGTIKVPSNITSEEEVRAYVEANFNSVIFSSPQLDYCGCDYEVDEFDIDD